MKKIHITESQYNELKKKLNEINLNGDENLNSSNGNATDAIRKTVQGAKNDGVNTDNSATQVSFSNDALKQNGVYECYTKKQLDEMKLANIKKNCKVVSKKALKENLKRR